MSRMLLAPCTLIGFTSAMAAGPPEICRGKELSLKILPFTTPT